MDSLVRFALAAAIFVGASSALAANRGFSPTATADPNRPYRSQHNVAADRLAADKKAKCPKLAAAQVAGLEPDAGTAPSRTRVLRAATDKRVD